MSDLTPFEQYLLELINSARAGPAAEAARLGITLNQGLTPGTISAEAKQPLAGNDFLNRAAADHSVWMLATDTFSHTGAGGSSAGDRIEDAGYTDWRTWGENISYRGGGDVQARSVVENHHEGLFLSPGHRTNILNDRFSEIGLGQEFGRFENFNASMLTQNFASDFGDPFLLGVVYNDKDKDRFFDPGEELSGVTVRFGDAVTTTGAGGGYEMRVADGTNAVARFSGGDFDVTVARRAQVGEENRKLDLRLLLAPEGGGRRDGDAGADLMVGQAGADRLLGWRGNDQIIGAAGNDTLAGGAGADRMFGGWGADRLWGGAGNDVLAGHGGADALGGGAGADRLIGGAGRDLMAGGAGADRFIFTANSGHDRVRDFEDGIDRLVIRSGADNFRQLDIDQTAAGAKVSFGNASVTLNGIDADELNAGDFIFI